MSCQWSIGSIGKERVFTVGEVVEYWGRSLCARGTLRVRGAGICEEGGRERSVRNKNGGSIKGEVQNLWVEEFV
jgi:hypothetical protein